MGEARRRPVIPDGLTLRQVAAELSQRLGRPVTPQQVHYQAVRRKGVPVGAVEVERTTRHMVEAILPQHLDELERRFRSLDGGAPAG